MRTALRLLAALSVGRTILLALGLLSLGAGAWIAWRADSSTALIVAGTVLILLALLRVREAEAGYGGGHLRFLLEEARDTVAEVAERDEVPADAREQLEEAVLEIDAVTGEVSGPGTMPRPSHRSLGGGGVLLELSGVTPIDRYQCSVTRPDGRSTSTWAKRGHSPFGVIFAPVQAIYPDDFPGVGETSIPGTYTVIWSARNILDPLRGPQMVARDRFTVPAETEDEAPD